MKKRFLSLVLAVAMMVSFCVTVPTFAGEPKTSNVELNVDVTSTKTKYKPGDTVTVDLNLENYTKDSVGIAGFQVELTFNSDIFDVSAAKKSSSLKVNPNEAVNTNFKGTEKTYVMLYNAKTDNPADEMGEAPGETETDNQGSYYVLPKDNDKIATIELSIKKDITADKLKQDIVTNNKLIFAARGGINDDGTPKGDKITATFSQTPINVVMPKVSSIAITTPVTKTEYFVGDSLNLTGGVITATKDDATTQTHSITADMVTGFDSSKAGKQTLTVTLEDVTTTFDVTVKAVEPTALSNLTNNAPIKDTEYKPTGTVEVTYNNGAKKTVNYPDSVVGTTVTHTVDTTTINKTGTITVSLGSLSATKSEVEVFANKITKAEITKAPTKIKFIEGSKFEADGEVTVTYTSEEKAVLQISAVNCKAVDMNKLGTQTVTISSFGDGVITEIPDDKLPIYEITIVEKAIQSITLENPPTEVFETQDIDFTGMTIKGTYDNGTTKSIDLADMTVSGYDESTLASETPVIVTVTVAGKTSTFPITVKARTIAGITVKTAPTNTAYTEGTSIDLTGGELAVKYNVGEDGVISMMDKAVTVDALPTAVGAATIKVHYAGFDTDLSISVIAKVPESIAITKLPTKQLYYIGQEIDLTGMVVTATYNNKTTAEITDLTKVKVDGFDSATIGEQTLTVSYTENSVTKTTTFKIKVDDREVESITISTAPKADFVEDQDFVTTGGKLSVKYKDFAAEEIVDITTEMCSKVDMTKVGKQTVTVNYDGKSATYEINIKAKALSSLTVTTPTKVEYLEDTDFDTTNAGMVVTAHYDNGKTAVIESKNVVVSGYDKTKVGNQDIKVTYTENEVTKETTFKVKVISKKAVEDYKAKLAEYQGKFNPDKPDIDLYRNVIALGKSKEALSEVEKEALVSLQSAYDKLLGEITATTTPAQSNIKGLGDMLTINAGAGNLFYNETILAEEVKITDEFTKSMQSQFGDKSKVLKLFNANLVNKDTKDPVELKDGDISILSFTLDVGEGTGLVADNVQVLTMDKAGTKTKAAPQVIAAEVKGNTVTFKGAPNMQYAVVKAEKSVPVPPTSTPETSAPTVSSPEKPLAPKPTTPTTGDESSIPMLIVIAIFTLGLGIVIIKKKHTK